jgi:hypothetical protein
LTTDIRKNSNIQFYQNPPSGGRVVPYVEKKAQEDRHDEANGRCKHTEKYTEVEAALFTLILKVHKMIIISDKE